MDEGRRRGKGEMLTFFFFKALWQSFPEESPSFSADTQFTWGGKLLISPVVTEGEVKQTN